MKKLFKAKIPQTWRGVVKERSQYNIDTLILEDVESEGIFISPTLEIRSNKGMKDEIELLGSGETIFFSADVEEQDKYYLGTIVSQKLFRVKNTKPITKEEYNTWYSKFEKDMEEALAKTTHTKSEEVNMYYGDYIPDDELIKICQADNPYESFSQYIEDLYYEEKQSLRQSIYIEVNKQLSDERSVDYDECVEEWIEKNIQISLPEEYYLKQLVSVDILIDNGDGNYDFTLNCVYPHYAGIEGSNMSEKAGLAWLVKQQGYSMEQLCECLNSDEYDEIEFLKTVRNEIINATTQMQALTFFVKMPLGKLFDLLMDINKPEGKSIIISKDVRAGLYDPWNGAGSTLEIALTKDVEIPLTLIDSALPDGGRGCSASSVYGCTSELWENALK